MAGNNAEDNEDGDSSESSGDDSRASRGEGGSAWLRNPDLLQMLQESWAKIDRSKNMEILRKDAAEITDEEEECGTSILTAGSSSLPS